MAVAVEHLEKLFRGISTGRARSGLLEHVRVEAYNDVYPIHHLAWVGGGGDARTLRVQPHDPSLLGAIRKALLKANLGLNPQVAGTSILVRVPQLDDEQRVRLVARVKKLAEEQRVAIRNIRKDSRKRAHNEDCFDKVKKSLDELTKTKIAEIDALLREKVDAINWRDPKWNR